MSSSVKNFSLRAENADYSKGTTAVNHRSYTLLFLQVEYIFRRYVQTSQQ